MFYVNVEQDKAFIWQSYSAEKEHPKRIDVDLLVYKYSAALAHYYHHMEYEI